jgi:hypothetical protein
MRERSRATTQELRLAIECLPRHTRVAMLEGISSNDIIVGAYTNRNGICPMLAAHRAGGRTDFISFAKAWDRYAFRGARKQAARRATERELLILRTHLEASLLDDDGPAADLRAAMAEHRELMARRQPPDPARPRPGDPDGPRPGDPDRSRELRARPGWAWLRVFRRYDDYQRALDRLDRMREPGRDAEEQREPEHV